MFDTSGVDLLYEKVGTGMHQQAILGPMSCPDSTFPVPASSHCCSWGVLVTTPQSSVWAEAGDTGTFQIPPEKLDPQVPAQGCKVASQTQPLLFSFAEGRGEGGVWVQGHSKQTLEGS